MDQHLSIVTLGVRDVEVSHQFYVDGLGWRPLLYVPGEIVFLQLAPGLVLGLFDRKGLIDDIGTGAADGAPARAPLSLAHNVDDAAAVDTVLAEAAAAGATIVKPAQRATFGGYHGYFTDPDGFHWEVAHNPGWRVDADGTVHIGGVTE